MFESLLEFFDSTGFVSLSPGALLMIAIACVLLYLAIVKGFEPLLLVPIGFGVLLANLPVAGLMNPPVLEITPGTGGSIHTVEPGGLLSLRAREVRSTRRVVPGRRRRERVAAVAKGR